MAHFRGIPTYLRERFGVPVVFYDGDVPMSLPERHGHRLQLPRRQPVRVRPRHLQLRGAGSSGCASSAPVVPKRFLGADTEFFTAPGREGLLLRLRDQVPPRLDGCDGGRAEPNGLEFALGGQDFHGDTGSAWLVGDVPFSTFAQAISQARINLNITRRSHASVFLLLGPPVRARRRGAAIVSNPYEGIERWFEPGEELLVVHDRGGARDYRSLLDDRVRPRRWAGGPASPCSTSTACPPGPAAALARRARYSAVSRA